MRIITATCPECGTVVAANELENNRVMKCPGLDCNEIFRFEDFNESERQHIIDNLGRYQL